MNTFLNCKDIMSILEIGKTNAYKIINQLNSELESKGYLTARGKVSSKYFCERYGIDETNILYRVA